MIQNKLAKDLAEFRAHGQTSKAKILAIVLGEMTDYARRLGTQTVGGRAELNDGEANSILRRHLRHAGISLQMNPDDPTAHLVIDLLSEYHVEDVMGEAEMRERILASGLSRPRDILKHLNSFGPAVDMGRARNLVRTVFGD